MKMHDLLFQLLSTGETFQSPEPLYLTLKGLKHLVNHKFPNVRALEYEIRESYSRKIQPEFYLLPEIFPGLNSLKLSGGFITGFSFDKFKHLRKLEIWDCYGFSNYSTGHETLEELIISNDRQHYVDINGFPKLHTIAFSLDDAGGHWYFHGALNERINYIKELSFYEFIGCYIQTGLQLPQTLRRLSVIKDEEFTEEELQSLIAGSLLEQLDLVDTPIFSNETQLWKAVTVCPSLKILNISGMKLKNGFFEPSRHHMEQALANRSEPLTLHCDNTGVNEQLFEKNFKHPNLKLSFLPLPMKMIDQGFVEIKFDPLIAD